MLEEAVRNCHSYAGVLRYLNIRPAGGSQSHIKRKIESFNINTSHFTGQASNKGKTFEKLRLTPEIVLVKRDSGRRQYAYLLRRSLIDKGVPHQCSICSIDSWLGSKLVLQVDHINGDWLDDRFENLRFLCPNCHSQTSNYGNKSV